MNQPIPPAWNEPAELKSFLARFSYMLPLRGSERRREYVFFRGWMPTFALLCGQIDAMLSEDKREFAWTKIREKFGAPSFSYQMRGQARHVIHAHRPEEVRRILCAPAESYEPLAVEIQELVLRAEAKLRSACIVCGAGSKITNAGGPWASLCADHLAPTFLKSIESSSLWSAATIADE